MCHIIQNGANSSEATDNFKHKNQVKKNSFNKYFY